MPTVLVSGTAVQDYIYRFDVPPARGTKGRAKAFAAVGGGSGANAAVTVARLGGNAQLLAPLGQDAIGDHILDDLGQIGVDTGKVLRLADRASPVCAAIVDDDGERTILTYHDPSVPDPTLTADEADRLVSDVDAVLVDDRHHGLSLPLLEAAKRRGIPGVLDGDRAEGDAGELIEAASHVIFGTPGLRGAARVADPETGLMRIARKTRAFVAVTLGAGGVLWIENGGIMHMPGFPVHAVDTLGAGDVFHGAFTLGLAEGMDEVHALHFASAVAAMKCSRFGGRAGIPSRPEIAEFLPMRPMIVEGPLKGTAHRALAEEPA